MFLLADSPEPSGTVGGRRESDLVVVGICLVVMSSLLILVLIIITVIVLFVVWSLGKRTLNSKQVT